MTQIPTQISDEMLMAYADGELDAAGRAEVEAFVQGDADAAGRLAAFARSGRGLGRLYSQPIHEPVPARLLETVRTTPMQRVPRRSVLSGLADALLGRTGMPAQFATAAIDGLIVAGGAHLLKPDRNSTTGVSESLRLALEIAPSRPAKDAPTGAVTPVLSFASVNGRFCRQYVQPGDNGQRIEGVGCRSENGEWRIEAQASVAGPGSSKSAVAPASGSGEASVESAVDRLIKGIALDPRDEAKLIAKHWRSE